MEAALQGVAVKLVTTMAVEVVFVVLFQLEFAVKLVTAMVAEVALAERLELVIPLCAAERLEMSLMPDIHSIVD